MSNGNTVFLDGLGSFGPALNSNGNDVETPEEVTTASFFRHDNLPEWPRKLSIARRLIDAWIAEA